MSEVEVLASWSGRGDYDFPCQSRIVRRKDKVYVVHDGWCGEREMRGGKYRPFVYEIPAKLVDRAVHLVANGSEFDMTTYTSPQLNIQLVSLEILSDESVKSLGQLGHTEWTKDL